MGHSGQLPTPGRSPRPPGSTLARCSRTTLVEVGQSLFVQLHSWGRGGTQHILQGWQTGLVLGGQLGLLLLEDGQGEDVAATQEGGVRSRVPGAHSQRQGQVANPGVKGNAAQRGAASGFSLPHRVSQIL